jgi:hypothetical protein
MRAERADIESQLAKRGWAIVEIEDQGLEWWADEIWRLESVWSPAGARAYVTFLVDPQSSAPDRKKGQGLWAVKASAVKPVDWGTTGPGEYTWGLGRCREEEMPGFFEHLEILRNEGA